MPFVLKFLAPEMLASAVIGKGGQVIKQMRESTGAKIVLTDHKELYPGTDCRVVTTQANSEESLADLANLITEKISDCVQTGAAPESLGTPGAMKLMCAMPRAAVGGIIGRGGAAIKQLREESNAKISITDANGSGPAAEQIVTISGSQEAIEFCMAECNRQVQALHSEPWFLDWASNPGVTVGGNGKGYGGALDPTPPWAGSGGGGGKSSKDGGAGKGHALSYAGNPGKGHASSAGKGGLLRPRDVRDAPEPQRTLHGGGGGLLRPRVDPPEPQRTPRGGGGGLGLLVQVVQGLPQYVMEDARGFAVSCVVPDKIVGGIIGRGGSGTKEVQAITGTKIAIREIPGDPENRSLNIQGPLSNTCAAYMLMMKRYLDAEAGGAADGPPPDSGMKGGGKGRR